MEEYFSTWSHGMTPRVDRGLVRESLTVDLMSGQRLLTDDPKHKTEVRARHTTHSHDSFSIMPMKGTCSEGTGPNGEYTINVEATNDVAYHYTFLDDDNDSSCFDFENVYLRDYFKCVEQPPPSDAHR